MSNQQRNNNEAVGMFVYHTDRYKNVYYDIFTKKGYSISNSEIKRFNLFSLKGIASFLIGFTCYYYLNLSLIISVIAAIAVYAVTYLYFRFSFMNKLIEIDNFVKPHDESFPTKIANSSSKLKICVMIILLLIFVILCFINIKSSNYEGINLYLNYALAGFGCIIAIFYFVALFKK